MLKSFAAESMLHSYLYFSQQSFIFSRKSAERNYKMKAKRLISVMAGISMTVNLLLPAGVFAYTDRTAWKFEATNTQQGTYAEMVDGNGGTRWTVKQENDQTLSVDLGTAQEFDTIKILNGAADQPTQYEIYVSLDGQSYTKVAEGAGSANITTVRLESPTAARYIQIKQVGRNSSNWWSVYELLIYDSIVGAGESLIYSGSEMKGGISKGSDGCFDVTTYPKEGHKQSAGGAGGSTGVAFSSVIANELKNEFAAADNSGLIDSAYTANKVNYIGHATGGSQNQEYYISPAMTGLTLEKGAYKLYYVGGNAGRAVTLSFDGSTQMAPITQSSSVQIGSGIYVYEFAFTAAERYTGDLVFSRSDGWLPDLYAAKLVNTEKEAGAKPIISLDKTSYKMDCANLKELQLKAATQNFDGTVEWSSSNPQAASVVNGYVTANGVGTARISAKAGESEAVCTVTVTDSTIPAVQAVENLPVSGSRTVTVGAGQAYTTIGAAVAYARSLNPKSEAERVVINVNPGIYREQIIVNVPYLTIRKTPGTQGTALITWYYGTGQTYYSARNGVYNAEAAAGKSDPQGVSDWGATLKVNASDFVLENIYLENSFNRYYTAEELEDYCGADTGCFDRGALIRAMKAAGKSDNYINQWIQSRTALSNNPYAAKNMIKADNQDLGRYNLRGRAAALYVTGDRARFRGCNIVSGQDTIGINYNRSYFEDCLIAGTVDYICGSGSSVFNRCELRWNSGAPLDPAQADTDMGYVAVPSMSEGNGYVFYNCRITGSPWSTDGSLGRPWNANGEAVFINTTVDRCVRAGYTDRYMIGSTGWSTMSASEPENARFAEYGLTYQDTGAAFDTSKFRHSYQMNEWTMLRFNPYTQIAGTDGWDPSGLAELYQKIEADTDDVDSLNDMFQSILADQINMQDQIRQAAPALKWRVLADVVEGNRTCYEELQSYFNMVGIRLYPKNYIVAVIEADGEEAVEQSCMDQLCDYTDALINQGEDKGAAFRMGRNTVVALMSYLDDYEDLLLSGLAIGEMIKEHAKDMRMTVSVGIGRPCEEMTQIKNSYAEAQRALKYKMMTGGDIVITYQDIAGGSGNLMDYIKGIEKLVSCFVQNKHEEVREETADVFNQMIVNKIQPEIMRQLAMQIMNDSIKTMNLSDSDMKKLDEHGFYEEYYKIMQGKDADEIRRCVEELLDMLMSWKEEQSQRLKESNSSGAVVEKMTEYIEENYMDKDLSLNKIADEFHLSDSHVSRIFKEYSGVKLMNYIIKGGLIRLRKCWKIQRKKSVSLPIGSGTAIPASCGFSSNARE